MGEALRLAASHIGSPTLCISISTHTLSRWTTCLGHEGEPVEDGGDALLVVVHHHVRHAVGVHDLGPAQLVLRRVHLYIKFMSVCMSEEG